MYTIKMFGKKYNNKTFNTYENARQYVRRKIRELVVHGKYQRNFFWTSNPMIGDYGFSIHKV